MSSIQSTQEVTQDEEIWKPVPFDKIKYYEVSSLGRVRNSRTNKLLNGTTPNDGYQVIYLGNHKRIRLHRLVALTFIPNPDKKPTIDHIDQNPKNNTVQNLRWATYAEQNRNQTRKGYCASGAVRQYQQIDLSTNKVIQTFKSSGLAARHIKKSLQLDQTLQQIQSKITKSKPAFGFVWRRVPPRECPGEVWTQIKQDPNYQISTYGRIKQPTGKISDYIRIDQSSDEYPRVRIGKTNYARHILVAQHFLPNPENKSCVNHKDGNKYNPCLENLEWMTFKENTNHAFDTGLFSNAQSVMVLDKKTQIRKRFRSVRMVARVCKIAKWNLFKDLKNDSVHETPRYKVTKIQLK
jgi:hypothetical protein